MQPVRSSTLMRSAPREQVESTWRDDAQPKRSEGNGCWPKTRSRRSNGAKWRRLARNGPPSNARLPINRRAHQPHPGVTGCNASSGRTRPPRATASRATAATGIPPQRSSAMQPAAHRRRTMSPHRKPQLSRTETSTVAWVRYAMTGTGTATPATPWEAGTPPLMERHVALLAEKCAAE